MIARSTIPFAYLRQLLLNLGLTPTKRGKFWYFEHAPSKTLLVYRPYRSRERVTQKDLQVTRHDLDWNGVLEEQAFDDLLKKATA